MERLTRKKIFGCMRKEENVVELRNVARDEYRKIEERSTEKVGFEQFLTGPAIDKLAAYEDIGLDPEELKELVKKYVPRPAKRMMLTDFVTASDRACRRIITNVQCPKCERLLGTHIHLQILDKSDGYSIENSGNIPTSDIRCNECGQLVSFKKEEKANG